MEKIRWGIIGAGGIADRRGIPALMLDPRNEIAAMMDRVPEVSEAIAQKYGVRQYFTDVETMLKTVGCDAVYIATPVCCHYEQAMLALKYGVHVFVEKPLAMNSTEGQKLVDAFRSAGLQLTVGYMMGYHNLHCKARELIREGQLGNLNLVRMQFSCWYPDIPGAWRQNRALSGGGCIMDLAVHCMELFHSITADQIADCKAFFSTKTFSYEVEDNASILFRSEKGVIGHIDVNFNIPDDAAASKLEIYGTTGSIFAEGTLGQEETGSLKFVYAPQGNYEAQQSRKVNDPQMFYGVGDNIYLKQFTVFNQLMRTTPDYSNAEQAVRIQQLCDKIYQEN